MKRGILRFLFCLFLSGGFSAIAQQNLPYRSEIEAFKKEDSLNPPPKKAILFVGSSSFRLWKDLAQAFPEHTIINRGFGGSSLPHVIQYANEIIFPYEPRQVVIYCGENDMTAEDVTGDTVFARFKELFMLIRSRLPAASIVFVSMKPSPSRWHLKDKVQKGNRLIKGYLAKQKNTAYVNVWQAMLTKQGNPREDLFVEDRLHMNAKGYAIWQRLIAPHLKNKNTKNRS